jgi:hypothetical protein
MQQIQERNARSGARPLIWLTLALHLALGAYLYWKTTTVKSVSSLERGVEAP